MKIKDFIIENTEKLKSVSETPRLDVEVILCHVLEMDKLKLMMSYDMNIEKNHLKKLERCISKRKQMMPVAYIINEKEFMGYSFYVDENVLIPRPDTEIVVEEAFKKLKKIYALQTALESNNRKITLIDMCTGSGAIVISISKLIESFLKDINRQKDIDCFEFIGADISEKALKISEKNRRNLNATDIKFIRTNLFESPKIKVYKNSTDIIVSNPPYIEDDIIETLRPDVKDYEPRIALSGGKSGMIFYNRIAEESVEYIKKGGYIIFESGHDQSEKIEKKLLKEGYSNIEIEKDLQGFNRMVCGQMK